MKRWKNIYLLTLIPPMFLYIILIFTDKISKKDNIIILVSNFFLWFVLWLVYDYFMGYWH